MATSSLQSDGRQVAPVPRSTESVGELVRQASEQLSHLVQQEIRLAVVEIKDKGRHAGLAAGLAGGATLVALFGVGAVLAGVIAALALVLPVWAAALIVGGVLLVTAAVLGLVARGQMSRAVPPVPEQAIASSKQDVAQLKERAHR